MTDVVWVLVWSCTLVFIATAIVTLLALIGMIRLGGGNDKIHDYYLKRLFATLILEIAGISVAAFALVLKSQTHFIDPKKDNEKAAAEAPAVIPARIDWIDARVNADWGGRDYAYTIGSTPKYKVKDTILCDANKLGYVATCWDARPEGYPPNTSLADFQTADKPNQWCTYKDNRVALTVPPDGKAPPGRVFICAQSVPR